MTFLAAKQKLHEYIDHADEQKGFELLAQFENTTGSMVAAYDEATLNILRERSEQYLSGQSTSLPL